MEYTAQLKKPERKYLPADFGITDWGHLEPWFKELAEREIGSLEALEKWLRDCSEVEAVISEDACWRQIRMTCDTTDKKLEEAFVFFVTEIQPRIQPYADQLNRKLIDSPFCQQLDQNKYFTYLRNVLKNIELFREENIPILSELSVLAQQYGVISGKMTVMVNEKEFTLQQAAKFLEDPDRKIREEVYRKINDRRLEDKEALHALFDQLVAKRHQVAQHAGFANYRDYKFREMGRFDYSKEDCFHFHQAVKKQMLPLVNEIYQHKKDKLGLDTLRPWDLEAEPKGVKPLRPFRDGNDLLEKTVRCFEKLNPFFAACLREMNQLKRFDLDSRKGKAPGGYNCPLAETGAPFIFMNAAGQMSDVTTMVHEGGHAIHSFLSHPLELTAFKEYPTEIAEVASMAMELFSMEHWDVFFEDPADLKRAKLHQLERVITIFPWIATIDQFQHWVYENPGHSREERQNTWLSILNEYQLPAIDHSGLESYRQQSWQRQLHLFEVPFYYIEYGIAQLAAIGMWKAFKKDKQATLDNYIHALQLGGTQPLPELYRTAGVSFNFSAEYTKELMSFVNEEVDAVFRL